MKKKIITIGLWTGIFMATMIVACAITPHKGSVETSHTSEMVWIRKVEKARGEQP